MVLSPEDRAPVANRGVLPNVVMAWKFGWQGGVLSGLLGSMMITIARQIGVGFSNLLELEIFLATRALLGIGLGIAISRQQHLAQNLHHYRQRLETELAARRADRTTDPHRRKHAQKRRGNCTTKLVRTSPPFKFSRNWSNVHRVVSKRLGCESNQRPGPAYSPLHPSAAAPAAPPRSMNCLF